MVLIGTLPHFRMSDTKTKEIMEGSIHFWKLFLDNNPFNKVNLVTALSLPLPNPRHPSRGK
jgi:hypothetical protein